MDLLGWADRPPPLTVLLDLIGIAMLIATVCFCVAMRWLSESAQLSRSADN